MGLANLLYLGKSIEKLNKFVKHFKTLIDYIFSSIISPEAISGNLTSTISDHLPRFMIVPNVFSNPPSAPTPDQTKLTFLEEIGQTLIKKILFLITFPLIGM